MKQKISEMRIITFLLKCFSSIEDNSEMNNGDLDTQSVQPEYKIERGGSQRGSDKLTDTEGFSYTVKVRLNTFIP